MMYIFGAVGQGSGARQVIRGSRLNALLLLLVCCAFVALSGWGLINPQAVGDHDGSMFGAVFFGLGMLIFTAQIVWPQTLTLDENGFTSRVLWRKHSQKWSDIEAFILWTPANGPQRVGYNIKPSRGPRGLLSRIGRNLGCDAGLPGGWKMSPQELLDTLQDWKARHG